MGTLTRNGLSKKFAQYKIEILLTWANSKHIRKLLHSSYFIHIVVYGLAIVSIVPVLNVKCSLLNRLSTEYGKTWATGTANTKKGNRTEREI